MDQNKLTNCIRRKGSFNREYPTKISNNTLRMRKGVASEREMEYIMKTSQKSQNRACDANKCDYSKLGWGFRYQQTFCTETT